LNFRTGLVPENPQSPFLQRGLQVSNNFALLDKSPPRVVPQLPDVTDVSECRDRMGIEPPRKSLREAIGHHNCRYRNLDTRPSGRKE